MTDLNTRLTELLENLDAGVVNTTLTVSTTTAGTGADTNETDLWSYSLPANTLFADGKGLRITVFGGTAANGNTKTIKVYFGPTALTLNSTTTAPNGQDWSGVFTALRTASNVALFSKITAFAGSGGQSASVQTSVTTTLANATTIRLTGTNGSASENDIVFRGAIVETIN